MLDISRDKADYSIWTPVTTRYSDQDPMRHINNVAVFAYLESGRTALLREMLGPEHIHSNGMVLANVNVDYVHEMTFPGTVDVGAKLVRLGNRSLTAHFAIFQGETCCAISESTNVFFDPETRKSCEPKAEMRAALEAYLD